MIIDPNNRPEKPEYDGPEQAPEGKMVLVPVGMRRWKSSKGNPQVEFGFVVFDALGDLTDEEIAAAQGSICSGSIPVMESMAWKWGDFGVAMGATDPFNPQVDSDLQKVLSEGFCVGVVVHSEPNDKGHVYANVDKFEEPPGGYELPEGPAFEEMLQKAKENWQKKLEYDAKRAAKEKETAGKKPNRGARRGGGGRKDDDIPF